MASASKPPGARKRARRPRIRVPRRRSDALFRFLDSYDQIVEFFDFLVHMVHVVDSRATIAHEALVDTEHDPVAKQAMIEAWEKRHRAVDELKKHRQFLLEIVLVRHVENYLNFLSSMLKEIFEARPETLRSSEKIELETVLRHATIDDLVRTIADRKVEALSYQSFGDLAGYFRERFSIALVAPEHEKAIVNAIEIRNISVHNGCKISERFVKRTGCDASLIGRVRTLGLDDVEEAVARLVGSAISVDRDARRRLGVHGHHHKKADSVGG